MAKATISKSKKKFTYGSAADVITITGSSNKIYTKGGKDKITLSKGKGNLIDAGTGNDSITVGKKAGNDNNIKAGAGNDTITVNGGKQTFDGGAGNDVFTVSAGTQVIKGGTGNDTFTVKGGNNHILRGGTGSDKYIFTPKMTKSTRLTINQSDYKKKDADTLKLAQVSKKDVTYGLLNGTLTIKHKTTGAAIQVTGWNKNKLSQIIFKNGTVKGTAVKAGATSVTWNAGKKVSLDANTVASVLQINGHKMGDVVATLNSKGQLVLREKDNDKGTLTISNWNNNTIGQVTFKYGNYSKTLTAAEFKERIYTPVTLTDNQTYSGGKNVHQEFQVNFSEKTNIVINSADGVLDRIRFTNAGGWSNDHENIYRNETDLIIGNWDSATGQEVPGKITIKDFMKSSVRQIEFSNQTYYLVRGNGTWTGSDTYSDRFMIVDWSKTGQDPNVGDWNVTIDGMRSNDQIDLRFLPANSRYYSLNGTVDGKDMVLTHRYSPTSSTETVLGTLRLKNYFNANGTVNTTNGLPLIRINREFYAGDGNERSTWFDGFAWNRITGSYGVTGEKYTDETIYEKNYRRVYVNAGTANNDEVELAALSKPNAKYAWLYYAGDGKDTITASKGDIVYGGNGDDEIRATGRLSEIRGNAGKDVLYVSHPAAPVNLDHVNVYGNGGEDEIVASGSYLYLSGGADNDTITIMNGSGEEAHSSCLVGGSGDDTINIRVGGYDHRAYGSSGKDTISVYAGHDHLLSGGIGNDTINLVSGAVSACKAYGGADDDIIYVEGGSHDNELYGGNGTDELTVVYGDDNKLYGGEGNDLLRVMRGDNTELYGGAGIDVFEFGSSYYGTNNTICDFTYGTDLIVISHDNQVTSNDVSGDDRILTFQSGGTVKVLGAKDMELSFSYRLG